MQETFQEFLNDYGSTTYRFKKISKNYEIKVLFSGIENKIFQRIVSIFLNNAPVIVAISETDTNNSVFMKILKDAANNSIGEKLFNPDSGIKRVNMQIKAILPQQISNAIIYENIIKLGYGFQQKELYIRESQFIFNNEQMHLTEYVLPSLVNLLK
ncbi:MAG TPA: hypothetical protein PKD00_07805 [Burkholderiales bacterium]|nr:hypothetical protein [Burkholderiales bacterium]